MFKYVRVVLKILPLLIFEYFAWILPYSINPKKYPFEKRFKKVQKLIIKVIKAFNIVSYDETYQKFINLPSGITKIRVYLWLEGQDVDCENNASVGDLAFTLEFSTNPS